MRGITDFPTVEGEKRKEKRKLIILRGRKKREPKDPASPGLIKAEKKGERKKKKHQKSGKKERKKERKEKSLFLRLKPCIFQF